MSEQDQQGALQESARRLEMKSEQGEQRAPALSKELPVDALIILPVRQMVLFPGMILPITFGREASIAAAQQASRSSG